MSKATHVTSHDLAKRTDNTARHCLRGSRAISAGRSLVLLPTRHTHGDLIIDALIGLRTMSFVPCID
jgi:hypothetical protein